VKVNKALLWDYDWKPEEYQSERFIRWYLGRVLSYGTDADVREIDPATVAKYLPVLELPRSVRRFWEWWLSERGWWDGRTDSFTAGIPRPT